MRRPSPSSRILTLALGAVASVLLTGCPDEPRGGAPSGTENSAETGSGDATAGLDETGQEPCNVVLQGVPGTNADCPEPGFFADVCGDQSSQLFVDSTVAAADAPETQEAEVTMVDFGLVSFAATVESSWSTVGAPRHCVIEKKIRVYERNGDNVPVEVTVEPPGGPGADNEDLASDPDTSGARVWYSDPYLAASEHGSVYLSVIKAPGVSDVDDGADCGDQRIDVSRDYDNEVQLWARGAAGGPLRKVAGIEDPDGFFYSTLSAGRNESNVGGSFLDHPRVAAWTDPEQDLDRVIVTWTTGSSGEDRFATLECSHADPVECELVASDELAASNSFPNPYFDENGDLYIARKASGAPEVQQLTYAGEGWSVVTAGGPSAGVGQELPPPTEISGVSIDQTPALWVGRIGQASIPSVFVAWTATVETPADDPLALDARVLLSAANSGDLTAWTEPVEMRQGGLPRSNEWGPEIRVNGADGQDFVDVVFQRGPEGNNSPFVVMSGVAAFSPWLTRFRAHDLVRFGEVSIAAPGEPIFLGDVPSRAPASAEQGLFAGEYLGLTQDFGARALVGWPLARDPGSLGIPQPDLGLSVVDFECSGP